MVSQFWYRRRRKRLFRLLGFATRRNGLVQSSNMSLGFMPVKSGRKAQRQQMINVTVIMQKRSNRSGQVRELPNS